MDVLTALFKLVAVLSIPLVILSVYMMVRSVGKARRITRRSLLIQLATSPALLVVYSLLLGISVAVKWAVPLVMLGIGLGGFWGLSTVLAVRNGQVDGTRSVLYIWLWGATFVLTQLLAVFATDGATAGGLATMCFSMGAAVGMNGSLFVRHRALLSAAAEGSIG